jgi:hypothetical protein
MPCFKGIAVSIHANGSPLSEHGVQKQSRSSRINTYIPVPQPSVDSATKKAEPAKFAISITLLTPGLAIPYSTPRPTATNPRPQAQYVGSLPSGRDGNKQNTVVLPYVPLTNSDNETIAAYIYFDGRAKEEVATLLRPGEETWVNSRWVQVPESEGGGLAEREFLFREVGLERWLNGLDLEGHDAAEKLERRRQKFEKRRRKGKMEGSAAASGMEVEKKARDTLVYGSDEHSPVEPVADDDDLSDLSSDDDEPPEATGQIKVAMFRVIASGEIKKGEYSPQFDAHDDDDEDIAGGKKNTSKGGVDADVEHTTSFAKPKTLDPKTISTQTVTGIDGPDRPYATFTFFYRGERQLQKMGVLPSSKSQQAAAATPTTKRRSAQLDFSNLGPLKTSGTVGFSAFRDHDQEAAARKKSHRKSNGFVGSSAMDEDSDEDDNADEISGKMEEVDDKEVKSKTDPEEAKFSGELADGVNRIRVSFWFLQVRRGKILTTPQLKRAHSVEPESAGGSSLGRKSPSAGPFAEGTGTPPEDPRTAANATAAALFGRSLPDDAAIGSPLKKPRASVAEGAGIESGQATSLSAALGDILGKVDKDQKRLEDVPPPLPKKADEEEL